MVLFNKDRFYIYLMTKKIYLLERREGSDNSIETTIGFE